MSEKLLPGSLDDLREMWQFHPVSSPIFSENTLDLSSFSLLKWTNLMQAKSGHLLNSFLLAFYNQGPLYDVQFREHIFKVCVSCCWQCPRPMHKGRHSAGKCDVIGPKNHVPMGTKVGKVTNKPYQRHLRSMRTFRQKIFGPRGPHWGPKVPRTYVPGSNFFSSFAQIL